MQRLNQLENQLLEYNQTKGSVKNPNDIVICAAVRTALTKSKKGSFKDTQVEQMLAPLLKNVCEKTKLDPSKVEDVIIGNVLQSGAGVLQIKMAMFLAGFKDTTTALAINRMCSSGLESVALIANKIQGGVIDIGIGGGVENMSQYDMQGMFEPEKISEDVFEHESARNCMIPMGQTSENVAEKFNISRQVQDQFALSSQKKAFNAQQQGLFKEEILPLKVKITNKDGSVKEIIADKDEGIRQTTIETLGKLKPVFKKTGTTTAGNSSQITDGAAVVLLAKRSVAESLNLPILAKYIAYSVNGCPPEIMGIGPAVAIPAVLKKAGLQISDIDIFEINEAFASQATYCAKELGIDLNKINPKGGAIAVGHPLGCTGARQIATLLPELRRTGGKYGVVSMCIGTGMGAAGIFELE